ncbi:MAG: Holliday junction resolvase RuvX [Gammaproteobacteria bacterium]|nr:MAG: Holliday junction resolvase RuvX [Gammaproteobacteria bacterium]
MPDATIETVIGFDYGTSWIGIAVGQTLTAQARPLSAIKSFKRSPNWEAISLLLSEWKPQKLIVGLPTSDYSETKYMTDKASRFSRQLHGRFHIDTQLIDERLTTREAYTIAIASGKRKSKSEIDSLSAVLITETWLREYQLQLGEA